MESIASFFPQRIKAVMEHLSATQKEQVEEIRFRVFRPIELLLRNTSYFITAEGKLCSEAEKGLVLFPEDGSKILNMISRHSIYAIEEELRRGYVTIRGGHRVGITGRTVVENGRVKHIKEVSAFNFRLAKEHKGIAIPILPAIMERHRFMNTLILSPPRCGKTTLLRDLIRLLSSGGHPLKFKGFKIGLVDERSEIGASLDGVPQNDLGLRTDVLDACPKAEGMMMLVRSMSPDIIATDEIGSLADTRAILEAVHSGVAILTTAHAGTIEDIHYRSQLKELFDERVFERYILLSQRRGSGTIEGIYNRESKLMSSLKEASICLTS